MSSRGSGGRDRDKYRPYDSGAAKHRAKEERSAREIEVLTATISATKAYYAPESYDLTVTSLTSDDPSSSNSYFHDLGMWPVNVSDSMREYWAAKGSADATNRNEISAHLLPDSKERNTTDSARKACSHALIS